MWGLVLESDLTAPFTQPTIVSSSENSISNEAQSTTLRSTLLEHESIRKVLPPQSSTLPLSKLEHISSTQKQEHGSTSDFTSETEMEVANFTHSALEELLYKRQRTRRKLEESKLYVETNVQHHNEEAFSQRKWAKYNYSKIDQYRNSNMNNNNNNNNNKLYCANNNGSNNNNKNENVLLCNNFVKWPNKMFAPLQRWEIGVVNLYRSIQQYIAKSQEEEQEHKQEELEQQDNLSAKNERVQEDSKKAANLQNVSLTPLLSSNMLLFQFTQIERIKTTKLYNGNSSIDPEQCGKLDTPTNDDVDDDDDNNQKRMEHDETVKQTTQRRPFLLEFYLQTQMWKNMSDKINEAGSNINDNNTSNNTNSVLLTCAKMVATWFVQNHYIESLYKIAHEQQQQQQQQQLEVKKSGTLSSSLLEEEEEEEEEEQSEWCSRAYNNKNEATECYATNPIPRGLLGDVAVTLLLSRKMTSCDLLSQWLMHFINEIVSVIIEEEEKMLFKVCKWPLVRDVCNVIYMVESTCIAQIEYDPESNNHYNNNDAKNDEKHASHNIESNLLIRHINLTCGDKMSLVMFTMALHAAVTYLISEVEHQRIINCQVKNNEHEEKEQKSEEEQSHPEVEEIELELLQKTQLQTQSLNLRKCESLLCLCLLIKTDKRFAWYEFMNCAHSSNNLQTFDNTNSESTNNILDDNIIRYYFEAKEWATRLIIRLMADVQEDSHIPTLYPLIDRILKEDTNHLEKIICDN